MLKGRKNKLREERRKPYMVCVTIGFDLTFDDNDVPHKKQLHEIIGYAETRQTGLQILNEYY